MASVVVVDAVVLQQWRDCMEAYDLDLPEFNGPVEGTRPTSISGKVDTPATPARGKGRKNTIKKEDTPLILSGPPPSGYRMNSFQLNNGIDIDHRTGGVRMIPNLEALQIGLKARYRLRDTGEMTEGCLS